MFGAAGGGKARPGSGWPGSINLVRALISVELKSSCLECLDLDDCCPPALQETNYNMLHAHRLQAALSAAVSGCQQTLWRTGAAVLVDGAGMVDVRWTACKQH